MANVTGIPRSRGAVAGVLLVLLGAWGGLIPFIGPYFRFAYTPDKAWAYTSGRLYLSVIPGAAVLLGGLLIALTRSRALGVASGLLAALGGVWFIAGLSAVQVLVKNITISPGAPVGTLTRLGSPAVVVYSTRMFAEQLGFFTGVGILVIFIAAIAIGRFSLAAARDAAADTGYDSYGGYSREQREQAAAPAARDDDTVAQGQYPAAADPATRSTDPFGAAPTTQFPATLPGEYPAARTGHSPARDQFRGEDQFPARDQFRGEDQFPARDRFPAEDQYRTPDQFPAEDQYRTPDQFPAEDQYRTSDQFPPPTEEFPPSQE